VKKDPVLAGAIAVVAAMIMSAIKPIYPQIYWGVLITLLIYGIQLLLKRNGFSWRKK
tara:strand:- start:3266 stop:3436 length:171 start_codon:yes stop_codon:yes gene_type:complete